MEEWITPQELYEAVANKWEEEHERDPETAWFRITAPWGEADEATKLAFFQHAMKANKSMEEGTIKQLIAQVQALAQIIERQAPQIEQLNQQLQSQEQTISQLKAKVAEQARTIKTLKANVSREKRAYQELYSDYQGLQSIWEDLQDHHPEIAKSLIRIVKHDPDRPDA